MDEPRIDNLLEELAALCGIEPHYYDNACIFHATSLETKKAFLQAMGLKVETEEELQLEVEQRRHYPWNNVVEPVQVVFPSTEPSHWSLYLPGSEGSPTQDREINWQIRDEAGQLRYFQVSGAAIQVAESRLLGGHIFDRINLPLPDELPLGYYELQVQAAGPGLAQHGRMQLIKAPEQVYTPPCFDQGGRTWGLNLPFYALRSEQNWGIGDFRDLTDLITWSGRELHAGAIGLNPLHHPGIRLHENISPYYPISRLYRNPLYLDLEAVPEMAQCREAQEIMASAAFQTERRRLNQTEQVDYPGVYTLKRRILDRLFATFLEVHGWPESSSTSRGQDLASYLRAEGEYLRNFATFLALTEHWQEGGFTHRSWFDWPPAFQDSRGAAVRHFADQHPRQILFHQYVQWLVEEQLQQVARTAKSQGMPLGLYLDLAVGVNTGGFDTWTNQGLFALNVDVGAPPDELGPLGQNWGLAPLIPERLRQDGYRFFIETIRQNCPRGGALRLDHVLGLFHLFWIPKGEPASQGAYVRSFPRELLAILALESVRRQALMVGEDLGTIPPYVRQELARVKIFSTSIFYFERTDGEAFAPMDNYPDWAQASITTHDLPTPAGFWTGRDLTIRDNLHLYPTPEAAAQARHKRQADRHRLLELLRVTHLLPAGFTLNPEEPLDLPEELRWGIISFLAQTPCRLVMLSLEDTFGWLDQQNQPGTTHEYPNWRIKLPWTLERIKQAPQPGKLAEIMARYRSGPAEKTK
jgi:4-alpha-glucanotransferase